MDSLVYSYEIMKNRLRHIQDSVPAARYAADIDNQTNFNNYTYDAIGNLIADAAEGITNIEWSVYGKVLSVWKNGVKALDFLYDGAGRRVRKRVNPGGISEEASYYVNEAGGNVLAIYESCTEIVALSPDTDHDGETDENDNCPCAPNPDQTDSDSDGIGDACEGIPTPGDSDGDGMPDHDPMHPDPCPCTFQVTPIDHDGDGHPDEVDDCPCEPDPEQDCGTCEEPLRLAEWLIYGNASVGRIATVKPEGIWRASMTGQPFDTSNKYSTLILSEKYFELKDHLGNVRVVVTDVKEPDQQSGQSPYVASVASYNNYYPYGMFHPSRTYQADGHRYGFNGKEMDNEVKTVTGGSYDYRFRMYDPRVAKFLSVDPLTAEYPELTPYQFASNTPVRAIDLDGLEAAVLTFEFRAILSGSSIGITSAQSMSIAVDKEGGVAVYYTGSLGVGVGRALTAGLAASVFPTATVTDISSGWGFGAGALYAPFAGMPGPAFSAEASGALVKDLGAKFAGTFGINAVSIGFGMGVWADVTTSVPVALTSVDEAAGVLDRTVGPMLEAVGLATDEIVDALREVQEALERLPVPTVAPTLETGARGPDARAPADETRRRLPAPSQELETDSQ